MNGRTVARAAALLGLFAVMPALADVTPQQYDAALTLRDRWEYLTRDVAFPASWVKGGHDFVYRETVEGG